MCSAQFLEEFTQYIVPWEYILYSIYDFPTFSEIKSRQKNFIDDENSIENFLINFQFLYFLFILSKLVVFCITLLLIK